MCLSICFSIPGIFLLRWHLYRKLENYVCIEWSKGISLLELFSCSSVSLFFFLITGALIHPQSSFWAFFLVYLRHNPWPSLNFIPISLAPLALTNGPLNPLANIRMCLKQRSSPSLSTRHPIPRFWSEHSICSIAERVGGLERSGRGDRWGCVSLGFCFCWNLNGRR